MKLDGENSLLLTGWNLLHHAALFKRNILLLHNEINVAIEPSVSP